MPPTQPPDPERSLADAIDRIRSARAGGACDPGAAAAAIGAIDAAMAAHQDAVYAMCRRIVGDPERARDVAQDALLVAWRKIDDFRGESRFRTWLVGIARYTALRAIRRRRELLTADGVVEADDPRRSVLADLGRLEREALITEASAILDALEQEAVYLRYVEGAPVDRITAVLALDTETGARGLLQRCRRKLKREVTARLEALGHGRSFLRTQA